MASLCTTTSSNASSRLPQQSCRFDRFPGHHHPTLMPLFLPLLHSKMVGTMLQFRMPTTVLFAISILLNRTAAQDPNPYISDGTCFYSAGNEADSRYIPCGNAALGNFSCCESQDMCLSNQACYNGRCQCCLVVDSIEVLTCHPGGVTYLAGCSDQSYSDDSCPDKGGYYDCELKILT